MRIQVVDSSTGEVIYVPSSNAALEAELHEFIDAQAAGLKRFQSRKHLDAAKKAITDAAAEIRKQTR